MPSLRLRRERGVSLIEALIAFAVMAFGMLAVVGMQTTLRSNADLARQRAEAVRLGQDAIEEWRGFTVKGLTTDKRAYDEIDASTPATTISELQVPGVSEPTLLNTTYTLTRQVIDEPTPNPLRAMPAARKTLIVSVSWTDRRSEVQTVRLSTTIAWIDPTTEASLLLAMNSSTVLVPGSHARGIPSGAAQLPGGVMGWVPPSQPTPPPGGRYALWIFDNVTGQMTICKTNAANMAAFDPSTFDRNSNECTIPALLVSGYLRFDGSSTPSVGSVANPTGVVPGSLGLTVSVAPWTTETPPASQCFFDATGFPGGTAYYCAVPTHNETFPVDGPLNYLNGLRLWSGSIVFTSTQVATESTPFTQLDGLFRICRYPSVKLTNQYVTTGLLNQNFVIITAGDVGGYNACPSQTGLLTGSTPEYPIGNPPQTGLTAAQAQQQAARLQTSVYSFQPLNPPTTSP